MIAAVLGYILWAMAHGLRFLKAFFAHPTAVGAVWPSSAALAAVMVEGFDWRRAGAVLEYGPGTGAFTGHILAAVRPGARVVMIERGSDMAAVVRSRFPGANVVEDSVEHVRAICDAHGIDEVQAIVSSLPWAAFPEDLQTRLLEAMMTVLAPGGQFATFAYVSAPFVPAARRFRNTLPRFFSQVETSPVVWRNFPPAFVYRCRR